LCTEVRDEAVKAMVADQKHRSLSSLVPAKPIKSSSSKPKSGAEMARLELLDLDKRFGTSLREIKALVHQAADAGTELQSACGNFPSLPPSPVIPTAIVQLATQVGALQRRDKLGGLKLDISGCLLSDDALEAIGRLSLCELGIWGVVGPDAVSTMGWALLAEGLCASQREGRIGPLKLRLVHCHLQPAARTALSDIDTVAPPPPPKSEPPANFAPGGIPIMIQDKWYQMVLWYLRLCLHCTYCALPRTARYRRCSLLRQT
jgi:hypothetical protein